MSTAPECSADLAEFHFMGFKALFMTVLPYQMVRLFDEEQEDNESIAFDSI